MRLQKEEKWPFDVTVVPGPISWMMTSLQSMLFLTSFVTRFFCSAADEVAHESQPLCLLCSAELPRWVHVTLFGAAHQDQSRPQFARTIHCNFTVAEGPRSPSITTHQNPLHGDFRGIAARS